MKITYKRISTKEPLPGPIKIECLDYWNAAANTSSAGAVKTALGQNSLRLRAGRRELCDLPLLRRGRPEVGPENPTEGKALLLLRPRPVANSTC